MVDLKVWDWAGDQSKEWAIWTDLVVHWVLRLQTQKECHFCLGLKTQCTTKSVKRAYYYDHLPNLKPLNLPCRQEIRIFTLNDWPELGPCFKLISELSHRLYVRPSYYLEHCSFTIALLTYEKRAIFSISIFISYFL